MFAGPRLAEIATAVHLRRISQAPTMPPLDTGGAEHGRLVSFRAS
jgi:hypothetical protein